MAAPSGTWLPGTAAPLIHGLGWALGVQGNLISVTDGRKDTQTPVRLGKERPAMGALSSTIWDPWPPAILQMGAFLPSCTSLTQEAPAGVPNTHKVSTRTPPRSKAPRGPVSQRTANNVKGGDLSPPQVTQELPDRCEVSSHVLEDGRRTPHLVFQTDIEHQRQEDLETLPTGCSKSRRGHKTDK